MLWRRLRNRYVVVFGLIGAVAVGWNLYVALNNDGQISGRVVGPDGRPISEATVSLYERTLTSLEWRATTKTTANGEFRFVGQKVYHFALEARKADLGASQRTMFRLYFRGQNVALPEPLRLEIPSSGAPGSRLIWYTLAAQSCWQHWLGLVSGRTSSPL